MKLGVICDGISRDLSHAVDVMDEFGLEYAELQFVGDKEVGDHSAAEIAEIKALLEDRGKPVSCLSRHVFAGTTHTNTPGDALHTRHMDALKRVMDMAHTLGSPLVRIMTPKKEQILWGHNGAEKWNVAKGAWETGGRNRQRNHGQLLLYRPQAHRRPQCQRHLVCALGPGKQLLGTRDRLPRWLH